MCVCALSCCTVLNLMCVHCTDFASNLESKSLFCFEFDVCILCRFCIKSRGLCRRMFSMTTTDSGDHLTRTEASSRKEVQLWKWSIMH